MVDKPAAEEPPQEGGLSQRHLIAFLWITPVFAVIGFVLQGDVAGSLRQVDDRLVRGFVAAAVLTWLPFAAQSFLKGSGRGMFVATALIGFGAAAVTDPDDAWALFAFIVVGCAGVAGLANSLFRRFRQRGPT